MTVRPRVFDKMKEALSPIVEGLGTEELTVLSVLIQERQRKLAVMSPVQQIDLSRDPSDDDAGTGEVPASETRS